MIFILLSGFIWDSQRYHKGDSFKILSPIHDSCFYGTLQTTFEFEDLEGNDLVPWIHVKFYGHKIAENDIVLEDNGLALLPLGHGYEYVHRVHIYQGDNATKLNTFYSPDYTLETHK